MKTIPSQRPRTLKIVSAALIACAIVAYGYESWTTTSKGRNCRVCAASYAHKQVFVYGLPVWSWDTEIKDSADTKNYFDPYLGYSHDHEWTGGGYSRSSRNLIGCGKSSFGPYPQHQMHLTRMGFQLVAASGMTDAETRRRYFESIMQPSDVEHYVRVTMTHRAINDQIPKEPWVKWFPYKIWSPTMDGITIPDYIRAGKLATDPL